MQKRKRDYSANQNALDDSVIERLAEARQAKDAELATARTYTLAEENGEYDDDMHSEAMAWGPKINARINQTLHRLTAGRWTWKGDQLISLRRITA